MLDRSEPRSKGAKVPLVRAQLRGELEEVFIMLRDFPVLESLVEGNVLFSGFSSKRQENSNQSNRVWKAAIVLDRSW